MDVVDESEIALDKSIENLDSENGYDSDECSTVKCSTATHIITASRRLPYASDDGLSSICESVTPDHPLPLAKFLDDQPSFQRFHAFVKKRGCANNLKFWVVCERFRKLGAGRGATSAHVREEAKAVYHAYLKDSAPSKVAVTGDTVAKIRLSIDLRKTVNLQQLFANAQKEVYDLMVENEYKQFLAQGGDFSERSSQFASDILPVEGYLSDGSSLTGYKAIPRVPHTSRGGSAVHSDVESTSIASYSDSEPGSLFQPARMLALPRRVNRHQPATCSDGEYTTRKPKQATEVVSEQFLKKVSDRLAGIKQDRDRMQKAVQDQACRKGQQVEDIQKLEWFDFPGCQKYVQTENQSSPSLPENLSNDSPQEDTTLRSPNGQHLESLANVELTKAMQQMERCQIRIQHPSEMHKSSAFHLPGNDSGLSVSDSGRPSSRYSSSQLSEHTRMLRDSSNSEESGGTLLPIVNSQTDSGLDHSGLSDPSPHVTRLYESGLPEPSPQVARYIQQQNECSDRDKAAVAAASMILDNTPPLEQQIVVRHRPTRPSYMSNSHMNQYKQQTGSRLSISDVETYGGEDSDFSHYQSDSVCEWVKHQRYQRQQPKIIRRPQLSEESSSDFTVLSSALFMPRGAPYHPCSDSEDPRYPMSHKLMHRPKTTTTGRRSGGSSSRSTGTTPMTTAVSSGSSATSKDLFAPKPGEKSIPVFYQVEGESTPYRRMVADKEYTLMEFKKLFGKKGDYRFFFKSWCEEIQGEIKDELIDDHDVIPKYQNKIFAFIEKSS